MWKLMNAALTKFVLVFFGFFFFRIIKIIIRVYQLCSSCLVAAGARGAGGAGATWRNVTVRLICSVGLLSKGLHGIQF